MKISTNNLVCNIFLFIAIIAQFFPYGNRFFYAAVLLVFLLNVFRQRKFCVAINVWFLALIGFCVVQSLVFRQSVHYLVIFVFYALLGKVVYEEVLSGRWTRETVYKAIFNLLMLNMIISILEYFNVFGLKELLYHLFSNEEVIVNRLGISNNLSRIHGLMTGYDINGIINAFFAYMILNIETIFQSRKHNKTAKKIIKYVLLACTIFVILLASRTGLIIFGVLYLIHLYRKEKNLAIRVIKIVSLVFVMLLVLRLFVFMDSNINKNSTIAYIYRFSFEVIDSYIETGRLYSDSWYHTIIGHYHLPTSTLTLFFGDNIINEARTINASDVAYIQLIYGVGIFGMCLYLLWIFSTFNKSRHTIGTKRSTYLAECLVALLISSFKGPYIVSSSLLMIFIIISSANLAEGKTNLIIGPTEIGEELTEEYEHSINNYPLS